MKKFNKIYYSVILESVSTNRTVKMLEQGLKDINRALDALPKNDPMRAEYESLKQQYEFKYKLFTEPVTVTCYDKTEQYPSAKAAIDYFNEGLLYCDPESSEADRYQTIIDKLSMGETIVDDN